MGDFRVLPWPASGSGEDGPPIFFEGSGDGSTGDVPTTGTIKVLVCLSYPTDRMPANPAAERQDIIDVWDDVKTFYDQASYNALTVVPEVTNWFALSGVFNDYYSAAKSNIDPDVLTQFVAECAQGAVDQGKDLDDYAAMACYIFANGTFLRAWGGWSQQNFAYSDGGAIDIDITADHLLGLMAMGEDADWGRCAHEVGHNLVSAGAVLGEDGYTSDLIDPTQATATSFEMMGSHDTHPLFSGENMRQLDWFSAANIVDLQWDRNPFSQEYDIAAHGLTEDATGGRVHLVRIQVTDGLAYYIETRQRPGMGSTQVFDTSIPLGAATNNGGVVVTKVLSDEVNNNQETRFITLLHDQRVLIPGDVATDPLRALEIRVVGETVSSGRLVSTVRVEWAQELVPDPDGDFDLRIEPWGPGWETVDIWVDRQPWGTFDNVDGMGNPVGNGDKPQVAAINRFTARARCDGSVDAMNVRVTYYAVTPPGVGDNGNWTPLETKVLPAITAGSNEVEFVNWVPTVGVHTCLKVFVEDQLGEVTFGNNQAQENVFEFEPAADSPPDPLVIPLAIRNPRDEPSIVLVRMVGIPDGWTVHLPHHWVFLPPLGERLLEAVVVTGQDVAAFEQKEARPLNMIVDGRVPRSYTEQVDKIDPASHMLAIGGINAMVTPKHRGKLELEEDPETMQNPSRIGLRGKLTPGRAAQPVEITLRAPDGTEQHMTAMTDGSGNFTASFSVKDKGVFKAQAFIVRAPLVAETQSNVVSVTK